MHARDLRLLFYFAQIVQAGSIRGAAEASSVSPPVVSAALRDLEELIGTTLLRRTTRRLDLTDSGREVFAAAEAMANHAGTAMSISGESRPVVGTLRISAPAELATSWLPDILATYRARWPGVRLFVEADDAPVAFARTDADLAIRASFRDTPEDAEATDPAPCAILPLDLVCAPKLGPLSGSLEARLKQTGYLLAHDRNDGNLRAWTPDGTEITCNADVTCAAGDRLTLHAMSLAGLGATLLIRVTVAADLEEGRLIRVDPSLDFGVIGLQLLPVDPQPAPPVLAFKRLMAELSPR